MIVPIVRDGKLQEWAIIELQGNLEFHYKNKCFVGDLHYEKNDTPVLIIGMHILHGKEAMLPKPLAILEKRKNEDDNTEYAVKAIVKKKLVFKGRPKPIVAGIIKN